MKILNKDFVLNVFLTRFIVKNRRVCWKSLGNFALWKKKTCLVLDDFDIKNSKEMAIKNHHDSVAEIPFLRFWARNASVQLIQTLHFLQNQYYEECSLNKLDSENSDLTSRDHNISGDKTWIYELEMLTSHRNGENKMRGKRINRTKAA